MGLEALFEAQNLAAQGARKMPRSRGRFRFLEALRVQRGNFGGRVVRPCVDQIGVQRGKWGVARGARGEREGGVSQG